MFTSSTPRDANPDYAVISLCAWNAAQTNDMAPPPLPLRSLVLPETPFHVLPPVQCQWPLSPRNPASKTCWYNDPYWLVNGVIEQDRRPVVAAVRLFRL